jgi:hypothetical protein
MLLPNETGAHAASLARRGFRGPALAVNRAPGPCVAAATVAATSTLNHGVRWMTTDHKTLLTCGNA